MKFSIPRITYALNEWAFGRDTLCAFSNLKEIEKYSSEKLQEYQFNKLKKLLVHADEHVPYYHESFTKVGFEPSHFNSFEDFQKIPVLTKAEIRNNQQEFISKDEKRRLTRYSTSGSTGEPLIFYVSAERIAANKAAYLLLDTWWKISIGDRETVLWASQGDAHFYNILKRVRDNLLHTRLLPAFSMNSETMLKYIKFIQNYKPRKIFGYAYSVYILARFAKSRNLELNHTGVSVLYTTAELLHDYQRQVIEDVFSAPVANLYGGRESGLVAFECNHKTMHLNPFIYTELIDGKIIITNLDSYGFPFIRYDTGDRGTLSEKTKCPCGVNFPAISQILGRDTDYIVNLHGKFIHPLALEYIFRDIEGIDYFKIIQKNESLFVVKMVTTDKFNTGLELGIKDRMLQAIEAPADITFEYIKDGDIGSEGKYKFVVSEIIDKYL
jgi:phenylacetate-CoA ligase